MLRKSLKMRNDMKTEAYRQQVIKEQMIFNPLGFWLPCCLPSSAFCLLPSVICLLPSAFRLLPSAFRLPPSFFLKSM